MSFLQEVYSNPFLLVELIIIILFIALQVFFFFRTKSTAQVFQEIFKNPLRLSHNKSIEQDNEDEEGERYFEEVILLTSQSKNEVNIRIKESINNYLLHNRGATVNYSIIKDIIEREVDAKENEISQGIPIPLYLGLSATIVGIIFGLFAMPDLASQPNGGSGVSDLAGINALINGVKIAMVASLSGLAWTIIISTLIYSKASKIVQEGKNAQLNYLQENLLPELFKAEDAGLIGLKSSIDNFSRLTINIVDEIQKSTEVSRTNIISQQETLDRIEKLNVTRISKVNLELFDRLEQNLESFYAFSKFIDQLSTISQSLGIFSEKAVNIDKVAQNIDQNLSESRDLTRFLTTHLEQMDKMGDVALYSFDLSEKRFTEAMNKLIESTASNVENVRGVSDDIERNFDTIIEQLMASIEEMTQSHISQAEKVYRESLPKFQNLDHLKELEEIKNQLKNGFNGTINGTDISKKLNNLELTNQKLEQIASLLMVLDKNTKKLKTNYVPQKISIPKWLEDFIEWFKSLFGS